MTPLPAVSATIGAPSGAPEGATDLATDLATDVATDVATGVASADARRRERLVVVGGTIALTTFFALLYALRAGITALDRGESVAWGRQIGTSLAIWWACLPLVPVMAWLVRVAPVARRHWLRNALILGAGMLLLAAVRQYAMAPVVAMLIGVPESPGSDVARMLSYFATFFIVAGLLHAVHFYTGLRAREVEAARLAQSLAEARLATLRTQLQPHFLFNTLNAITALVHHEPYTADRMLTRLATLLRSALRAPAGEEHALRDELEVLDQYLELMAMRFGDRLAVERVIDPAVLDAAVPWMVLQPLVENALEHGLGERSGAGRVRIEAVRDGQRLRLTVEDDGVGLAEGVGAYGGDEAEGDGTDPTYATNTTDGVAANGDGRGIGVRNTRRRLRQLHGAAGTLVLEPGPAGGTRAVVHLPLRTLDPRATGAHA